MSIAVKIRVLPAAVTEIIATMVTMRTLHRTNKKNNSLLFLYVTYSAPQKIILRKQALYATIHMRMFTISTKKSPLIVILYYRPHRNPDPRPHEHKRELQMKVRDAGAFCPGCKFSPEAR
jgi:hypothetical protein